MFKFDITDIRNAMCFLTLEVLIIVCIGGYIHFTESVDVPITDKYMERTMETQKLEYNTLPVPTSPKPYPQIEKSTPEPIKKKAPVHPISKGLIKALCLQESNNDPNALGDYRNGKPMAKGILQIWPAYISDVNRVYGDTYSHDDMFDKDKAIDVTIKYLTHYGKHYTKVTGKQPTDEVYARMHNGGVYGWKNPKTDKYWEQVQSKLKTL